MFFSKLLAHADALRRSKAIPALIFLCPHLLIAETRDSSQLADEYASCAAYYLLISKSSPRLRKYAPLGVAAAENATILGNQSQTLDSMGKETKRFLSNMGNDWANANVVISEKADTCKKLMTISEE